MTPFLLAPVLFIIAAAYASVGLGGGTAYLSVLSFESADPQVLRPMAWALNVLVALIGFRNFSAKGHFEFKNTWHYLLGGTIGAALGAMIPISEFLFRGLLAVTLIVVALRMVFAKSPKPKSDNGLNGPHFLIALAMGFLVGVLSGVVGIGGGIILGPIVIAFGWLDIKRSAALTSLYILLCSAGALTAHLASGGPMDWRRLAILSSVVVVGGYLGSRFGSGRARPKTLQRIMSVIVLVAGLRLVYGFVMSLLEIV